MEQLKIVVSRKSSVVSRQSMVEGRLHRIVCRWFLGNQPTPYALCPTPYALRPTPIGNQYINTMK